MGYKIKRILVGTNQVRPPRGPRTFTISWTEQSNMSSGWTYSDDAAGLTAGDGAFDDFFGYSAVLLNTSGVETAEMKQTGGVFTGAMSTLGNITSGDNVMIKFPVRGIKMTKSGSTVTLSITEELNKSGYQYYAHSTGTLSNPGTPKDQFYLGAYKTRNNGSDVIKSRSGVTPTAYDTQANFCAWAKANGSGYNIIGYYQRMYITCLYMMKYGNPDSQSVVGKGYTGGSGRVNTGGTDSQTSATYGTSSNTQQVKLFGLEDWWGNLYELVGGVYITDNKLLYTQLSGYSGTTSGGEYTGSSVQTTSGNNLSSIVGTNKVLFGPSATVSNSSYNTYYCDYVFVPYSYNLVTFGSAWNGSYYAGVFNHEFSVGVSDGSSNTGTRLLYL